MKKIKITNLAKNELRQIIGGKSDVHSSCAGCLCDADVSGQMNSNSGNASSKAG